MEAYMVRTQIQLTEEQAVLLKKIAAAQRVSIARLIRLAVDNLVKSSAIDNIVERRKKAVEIAGKFHSGLRDLSSRHDDYFADTINR